MMEFQSPIPSVPIPSLPYHEFILKNIDQYGDTQAMVDATTERVLSYSDLKLRSQRLAGALCKRGLQQGQRVCVFLPNCVEYPVVFLGVLSAGGVVHPVNSVLTHGELEYQLDITESEFIITSSGKPLSTVLEISKQRRISFKHIIVLGEAKEGNESFETLLAEDNAVSPNVGVGPEDIAALKFSSGTTGPSKAVMMTHQYFVGHEAPLSAEEFGLPGCGEATLCLTPLFHSMAQATLFAHVFAVGGTAVIFSEFEVETFYKAIDKYQVRLVYSAPPVMHLLTSTPVPDWYNGSSLTTWVTGAAPLSSPVCEAISHQFHISDMRSIYGSTECGTISAEIYKAERSLDSAQKKMAGASCVGVLLPGVTAKVRDLSTNASLGANEEGEILVKSPTNMKGYWRNPEATADTITEDGWVHTGDVGYFDVDGILYFTARTKEMIKYMGYTIAPADLDSLLQEHPSVADAAVIGVPAEDGLNQLTRAYVMRKTGCDVTEQDIIKYVEERSVWYKHLRGGVAFVDEIPKSPSGKILRRTLLQLYEQQ